MDYYGSMKRSHRLAPLALILLALVQAPRAQTTDSRADTPDTPDITPTALDAELFYQLLLGEINASGTEPGAG